MFNFGKVKMNSKDLAEIAISALNTLMENLPNLISRVLKEFKDIADKNFDGNLLKEIYAEILEKFNESQEINTNEDLERYRYEILLLIASSLHIALINFCPNNQISKSISDNYLKSLFNSKEGSSLEPSDYIERFNAYQKLLDGKQDQIGVEFSLFLNDGKIVLENGLTEQWIGNGIFFDTFNMFNKQVKKNKIIIVE